MECALTTLHALIACFSWGNFYVSGGLAVTDFGQAKVYESEHLNSSSNVSVVTDGSFRAVVDQRPDNPYGMFVAGYEMQLSRKFSLNVELFRHVSSLETGRDRGINSGGIYLTVHPFR